MRYQAQKPHLLFAIFLAFLKTEVDDEVRRESAIFPFLDLMRLMLRKILPSQNLQIGNKAAVIHLAFVLSDQCFSST